jgi:hypothetical protein
MLRNRDLHDSLRQFALDAAAVLSADHEAGAEIEFEIDSEASRASRGGPTLYRYRPLTERFVAERWPRLRALESCEPAAIALGAGAERWLRMSGLRGDQAEPALHAMLERLYEDSTGFAFPEERFERLYAEVEQMLYVEVRETRIVAPLDGLELEAERVELLDGFALVRGDSGDYPPEAVWPLEADGEPPPRTLCVLEREIAPDDPLPITEARERFGRLVTGLRLFKPGGIALGAVGWTARADDRWQPLELGDAGVARGEPWILVDGEEVELRAFLVALERSPIEGTLAWALSRFEMGCARRLESEALSDYLLALRALLGDDGGAARATLALRLAALCAEEGDRRVVQRRAELAVELERFVMNGQRERGYLAAIGSESPRLLVSELERHTRALLRDVICGYLSADLAQVADEILLESRPLAEEPEPEPEWDPVPEDELPPPQTAGVQRSAADTAEVEALGTETEIYAQRLEPEPEAVSEPEPEPEDEEAYALRLEAEAAQEAVFDDDADHWSAPV